MDRFKFRGKDKHDKWVYGSLIYNAFCKANTGEMIPYIFDPDENFDCFEDISEGENIIEVDPKTVGQCTGVKDKNGKLIFEGDIVSGSNGSINGIEWPYKIIVKYNKQEFRFTVPSWAYDENGEYHGRRTHYVEITGNIHEVK